MTAVHRPRPSTRLRILKDRLRALRRPSLVAVAVGLALIIAGSSLVIALRVSQAGETIAVEQRDATAAKASDLVTEVLGDCSTGETTGAACEKARDIAADPIPGKEGPRGETGPGPSSEQVQAAVAAELARNPPADGRSPTTAEVAAIVAAYLIDNPPQPGRPPTAGEIAAAVGDWFAVNPPPAGRDGEPGRPPTPEEIRAAVEAELAENPPPAGATGAQGIGVQSVTTETREGMCVLVFVLVDPATATTAEQVVPVPIGICEDGLLFGP